MNKKGFTLTELLVGLAIIGILSVTLVYIVKGTLSTSMTQLSEINDNEVYEAAKMYAIENNAFKDNDSICILVSTLVDNGYLDNNIADELKAKIVKITRNSTNKTIEEIKYVLLCN